MLIEELQAKHDAFVNKVAQLLGAQQEYFALRKRGYPAEQQLAKSKRLERDVRKLIEAEVTARSNRQQQLF